ncbi:MAG TPA: hypothetical protein PLU50_08170, partial [Pseudobdellovibrionaceae bacterium]|nr:hypothetical protein [Pseudobdellovibrionaceae bacterium]
KTMRKLVTMLLLSALCFVAEAVPREQERPKIETVILAVASDAMVDQPAVFTVTVSGEMILAQIENPAIINRQTIEKIAITKSEYGEIVGARWRSWSDVISHYNNKFIGVHLYKKIRPAATSAMATRGKPCIRKLS